MKECEQKVTNREPSWVDVSSGGISSELVGPLGQFNRADRRHLVTPESHRSRKESGRSRLTGWVNCVTIPSSEAALSIRSKPSSEARLSPSKEIDQTPPSARLRRVSDAWRIDSGSLTEEHAAQAGPQLPPICQVMLTRGLISRQRARLPGPYWIGIGAFDRRRPHRSMWPRKRARPQPVQPRSGSSPTPTRPL